jgi:hypothetical protein
MSVDKNTFNLSLTSYGQKIVYYRVPRAKILRGLEYMGSRWSPPAIFIYEGGNPKKANYLCSWSPRWKNFTFPDGSRTNYFPY